MDRLISFTTRLLLHPLTVLQAVTSLAVQETLLFARSCRRRALSPLADSDKRSGPSYDQASSRRPAAG